jgi:hypothetical protein
MVNYSNGKIYKIEAINAPDDEKVYIGSTTKQYLSQRMDKHRSDYRNWKDGNEKYSKITSFDLFDKYGIENCVIVLIELVNANSKDELLAREKHFIKTMNSINKLLPKMDKEEKYEQRHKYYESNKERIKMYQEKNKEIIKEVRKERERINQDVIKVKTKAYKDNHKEELKIKRKEYAEKNSDKIKSDWKKYYDIHKEEIKERRKQRYHSEIIKTTEETTKIALQQKQYRENNKDKINLIIKAPYECICGSEITKGEKARHEKTIKHHNFLNATK